jgi:hypothetical protein
MNEELRSKSRHFRTLEDGDENGGQLFALLAQRSKFFRANDP